MVCRIGRGSYGEVWLARNVVGTFRAVKVIYRSDFDHDRPYEREFEGIRRFEPLSRSHEGFVDILQLGRNDEAGYFYYVMEVADPSGDTESIDEPEYSPHTLRTEILRRGRLPLADCVKLGAKLADALAYLHGHGLVHRDIKPSNIIFVSGVPKLADIGLVAAFDETRSYVGTEGFMPPEGPGNPQADLYSLGKVLYEISTGNDRQDYPKLPADFKDNADRQAFAELNEIIIKACYDDSGRRYRSAEEMYADLSAMTRGESVRRRRSAEARQAALRLAGMLAFGLAVLWGGSRLVNPGFAAGLLAVFALVVLLFLVRTARAARSAVGWGGQTGAERGMWLGAGALLLLAFLVGVRWSLSQRDARALAFASRDSILVTDFSNETGDPVFDRSLWTAFTVGLQQSRYANVLPRSRIEMALARMDRRPETRVDEAVGREVCLRENARGLVVCDVARFEERYVISARLVDPSSGETVRAYQETASGRDGVIAALGRIVEGIREDLGESLAAIRQNNRPLPRVTTHSLGALKAFADGRDLWSRGSYKEAVTLYETALSLDPEFAMAHAELGAAYFSFVFNRPSKGLEHYRAALSTGDRISDRERLYIEAAYRRDLGHVEESLQYHRLYLAAYPDDADTRYNLGTFLMLNGRPEEAAEQFREVLRIVPDHVRGLINLASSYQQLDKCDEALSHYGRAFELEPDRLATANLNSEYAFTLARTGKVARARETMELTAARPDTRAAGLRSLALLDMYEGKYRAAEQRLRESTLLSAARRESLTEARTHLFISILLDGYGDRGGRLQEIEAARQCLRSVAEPPLWLAFRIGAACARSGAMAGASETLRYLKSRADPRNPRDQSLLHLLEGELAMMRGDAHGALQVLHLGDREFPSPETMVSLARASDFAGEKSQAREYYGRLIANGRASLGWEPQQDWITAHFRVAEIDLERGEREKAALALQPILGLWHAADPELPLTARLQKLARAVSTGYSSRSQTGR